MHLLKETLMTSKLASLYSYPRKAYKKVYDEGKVAWQESTVNDRTEFISSVQLTCNYKTYVVVVEIEPPKNV